MSHAEGASLHGECSKAKGSNSSLVLGNDSAVVIVSVLRGRYTASPIIGCGMFPGIHALITKTLINLIPVKNKLGRTDPNVGATAENELTEKIRECPTEHTTKAVSGEPANNEKKGHKETVTPKIGAIPQGENRKAKGENQRSTHGGWDKITPLCFPPPTFP